MEEKTYIIMIFDAEVDNIRLVLNKKQLELLEFLEDHDCLSCTLERVDETKIYNLT